MSLPVKAALAVATLALLACTGTAQVTRGSAPKDTLDCEVAVVGGGPAGVYTAYRLLETNSSINVCLYEATHRVGGRIYSVRNLGVNQDLVLDMGAYRYMPLVQPLITDLIQNLLQLPNRLYQPGVPDYKIVLTPDGSNAGFALFVEKLLSKAITMGLQVNLNTEITRLTENAGGGFTLTSKDGGNSTASQVVLNLPSRPLNRLLQNSFLPQAEFNEQLHNFYQIRATKLYLYYPNAWWVANGLVNGTLALNPFWNQTDPNVPIVGRYHDGHVKCASMGTSNGTVAISSASNSPKYVDYYYENSNSLNTNECYGFIQATYTNDGGTTNTSHYPLDYLVDYASPTVNPTDNLALPYSVWDNTTFQGAKLLKDAHEQMVASLALQNITLPDAAKAALPTEAVVAFWDPSVTWSGGAWHNVKVEGADDPDMVEMAIKPFSDLELYVANEAYGTQLGWAEGGLVMAENILVDYFGATTPSWMRNSTASAVKFGPTYSDFETAAQGTGRGTSATAPSPAMPPMMSG